MNNELVKKIKNNPDYQKLIAKKSALSIKLSLYILVVYFSFILIIAFYPAFLAIPIATDSVITIGIPIGILIIIFAFILTGIYTSKANKEFDDLTNKIKQATKTY